MWLINLCFLVNMVLFLQCVLECNDDEGIIGCDEVVEQDVEVLGLVDWCFMFGFEQLVGLVYWVGFGCVEEVEQVEGDELVEEGWWCGQLQDELEGQYFVLDDGVGVGCIQVVCGYCVCLLVDDCVVVDQYYLGYVVYL